MAVKGGKCISHGAKKKACEWREDGGCDRRAVLEGLCKRHHNVLSKRENLISRFRTCLPVNLPRTDSQRSPVAEGDGEDSAHDGAQKRPCEEEQFVPQKKFRDHRERCPLIFDDILKSEDTIVNEAFTNTTVAVAFRNSPIGNHRGMGHGFSRQRAFMMDMFHPGL